MRHQCSRGTATGAVAWRRPGSARHGRSQAWAPGPARTLVLGCLLLLCGLWLAMPARGAALDPPPEARNGAPKALSSRSARERSDAAIDLYNNGQPAPSAVPMLLWMLTNERERDVRRDVTRALGAVAGLSPEVVPALIGLLREDRDTETRVLAAKSLGRLGLRQELAVPALLAALKDPQSEVSDGAAEALDNKVFAASAALIAPVLASALNRVPEYEFRGDLAAQTLGRMGPYAIAALPTLRTLLGDPSAARRSKAAWVIGRIGPGAAAAAPQCLALLSDKNALVRVEAATALLALGQPADAAMQALLDALSFENRSAGEGAPRVTVVSTAARAIGEHAAQAPGNAASKLAILMRDPEEDVRGAVNRAFRQVLAAYVQGKRLDAIGPLGQLKLILQSSPDSDMVLKAVAVSEAVAALEAQAAASRVAGLDTRSWAMLLALAAAACCAAAAWRWRAARVGAGAGAGARVLLSYRRQDNPAMSGRVYDQLVSRLGPLNVFRDIDSLAPGDSFAQKIQSYIAHCDVVIVLIGLHWLAAVDSNGRRRLDDPEDFVRLEVAEALKQNVRLIPALHDGASMPAPGALPAEIATLAQRNAIELTDRHFKSDMEALARAVAMAKRVRRVDEPVPRPGAAWSGVWLALGIVFGLLAAWLASRTVR